MKDASKFAALWFALLIGLAVCSGITYALVQTDPQASVAQQ